MELTLIVSMEFHANIRAKNAMFVVESQNNLIVVLIVNNAIAIRAGQLLDCVSSATIKLRGLVNLRSN